MEAKLVCALMVLSMVASSLQSRSRPLEAEEILALISIPDEIEHKTIDEVIADAEKIDAGKPGIKDDEDLVDGDIIVSADQRHRFFDVKGFAGAGLIKESKRWPKAIVPYKFESDFREYEKNVYSAMKEWMEKTCVRFTPRGSTLHKEAGHPYYIRINGAGRGCSSHIGYDRYNSWVSLSVKGGCATHGTSLHELGHALGLAHEHQRIDRDKYLKVIMENTFESHRHNFVLDKNTTTFGMPYDYCSVMHYGPYSFSKYQISRPTMLTKNPNYQFTIGKPNSRKRLSFHDAQIINLMYKCNAHCSSNVKCKAPCYVNHKCACQCPSEPCPKKPCRDYQNDEVCRDFKSRGMCGKFEYTQRMCAETCGVCAKFKAMLGKDAIPDDGSAIPPFVPPTRPTVHIKGVPGPKCKDSSSGCSWFANKAACMSSDIASSCPKSCGYCKNCGDKEVFCPEFANEGKCNSDPKFMYAYCNYSCELCQ